MAAAVGRVPVGAVRPEIFQGSVGAHPPPFARTRAGWAARTRLCRRGSRPLHAQPAWVALSPAAPRDLALGAAAGNQKG